MDLKITNTKEKRFFSKSFDRLTEVEMVVKLIREDAVSYTQLTLLVKLYQSNRTDAAEDKERNDRLITFWKKLLGPKTNFGFFTNLEIGTVFVAGPLSEIFLHDLGGKKLAELSEGPYGILRGLGIDEAEATNYVKKLDEGGYLLLVRGHSFDITGLEGVMKELDKAG